MEALLHIPCGGRIWLACHCCGGRYSAFVGEYAGLVWEFAKPDQLCLAEFVDSGVPRWEQCVECGLASYSKGVEIIGTYVQVGA